MLLPEKHTPVYDFTYEIMGSMDSWCLYSYYDEFLYLNCLRNNNLSFLNLIDKYPTRTQPLLHLLLNNV